MIKPFPLESGHPANHGFIQCARCGTWRKVLQIIESVAGVVTRAECADGCRPSTLPSHLDAPKPAEIVFVAHAGSPEVLP